MTTAIRETPGWTITLAALSLCVSALMASLGGVAPASAAMPNCTVAAIAALNVPQMTLTSATEVPAAPPNPEYCDVRGSVDTEGNAAGFRFQLPANWNRKLLFYGVGGTGGSVLAPAPNPVDMAQALVKGYATAVTDTGHQGGNADASFALLAPGVPNTPAFVDYAYRAAHEVTVAAKQLLRDFYTAGSVERSYFDGCSNGGRMALIAAMHYPDDYDGIIAGDPATNERLILSLLKGAKANLAPPAPASRLRCCRSSTRPSMRAATRSMA